MSKFITLESLESRRLMSVVPVSNTNDTGPGSIRQAMLNAQPGDTVDMTNISGTVTLLAGPLAANKNVTLLGPGQSRLTLQGGGNDPVFLNILSTLIVKDVTITGGKSTASSGGGVFNRGALELDNVTLRNNHAHLYGGGLYSSGSSVVLNNCSFLNNSVSGALESSGGGLFIQDGTLTMRGCTFKGNIAYGSSNVGIASGQGTGGGVFLQNTLDSTITNCTFGDNVAQGGTGGSLLLNGQGYGGAIYTNTSHATLINHCTVAYNSAKGGGNAQLNTLALSQGGGIYSVTGTTGVTLQDTISALNTASNQPDIVNTVVNSLGGNLIGIYSGTILRGTQLGDLLGTVLQPYAPRISSVLAMNGGETLTYALMSDSPAINAGNSGTSPALDQRGLGRRDTPDIGAFEYNPNHLPEVAANAAAAVAGVAFRQPIAAVDADNDTLTITSTDKPAWLSIENLNGTWTLVGTPSDTDAAAISRFRLNINDGFQTVTVGTSVKVGIPGIDLSPSGLLRVNGTEFNDELSITLADDDTVRVVRNGFKRSFALGDVKKLQLVGFGGDDNILVNVAKLRASVFAGDGMDTIKSGAGADYLDAGAGDDIIYAGAGNDRIDADDGRDRLFGEAGNDTLHGGAGRDMIDGGIGRNRLFGDSGNDTFFSLQGTRDSIDGGLGDDNGQWNSSATVIDAVLK